VDPVPRLVHLKELPSGDLRQPDRGHIANIAAEDPVHLFVDALRLDGNVVEVGLAVHGTLAFLAVLDPGAPVRQRDCGAPLLGDSNELLERSLRVGHDAEVRSEDTADLGGLDVDVNETPSPAVGVESAGVAGGPP